MWVNGITHFGYWSLIYVYNSEIVHPGPWKASYTPRPTGLLPYGSVIVRHWRDAIVKERRGTSLFMASQSPSHSSSPENRLIHGLKGFYRLRFKHDNRITRRENVLFCVSLQGMMHYAWRSEIQSKRRKIDVTKRPVTKDTKWFMQ